MPWVDILVVLLIAVTAFIGYNVGLFGALNGFISKIVGLVAAWLLTPIAQAWLEVRLGAESFLAELIRRRIPAPLEETIRAVAQTAQSLQEFRDGLLVQVQPEIASYLQGTLSRTGLESIPSAETVLDAITREIAQYLMWAFLFFLIWMIVSILVKGFLGLVVYGKDGKTILGVFDGFLGMAAMTAIVVVALIAFSGLVHPLALMATSGGNMERIYPYLLDSKLITWLSGIYQLYIIPWLS